MTVIHWHAGLPSATPLAITERFRVSTLDQGAALRAEGGAVSDAAANARAGRAASGRPRAARLPSGRRD